MKFLARYLWQRRKLAAVFLLFCLIFLCVFFLYQLPVGAVLYPAVVCAIFGLLFVVIDWRRAVQRHRQLRQMCELPVPLMERFPGAETIEHEDYQAILDKLRQEYNRLQTETQLRDEEMVEYYTIWVHQIKTPIASMRLTLQNENSDFSRRVAEDLFRIEQYVEMVLVFLRLGADSTDYVFGKVEMDPLVRGTVKKFASQFIRKKIRLQYMPSAVWALTDEKWLSFVLEQLLSNALKYTPAGGTITIDWEEPMTLCIRDTGIGIAPEDLPRVFEKGYTGYNGRSDKRATGLGLYLCQRICHNLGHALTMESQLDRGTVVRIGLQHREMRVE